MLQDVDSSSSQNALAPTAGLTSGGLIQKLPAELLVQIFRFCLESIHPLGGAYAKAIYCLRGACRRWYGVVEDTPNMWSHICTDSLSSVFNHFLKRSKSYPLSIFLVPDHDLVDKVSKLISQAERCQRLMLVTNDAIEDFGPILRVPMPIVEQLVMIHAAEEGLGQGLPLFDGNAPRLRTLIARYIWPPNFPANANFGIVTLELDGLKTHFTVVDHLLDMLQATPRLRNLKLIHFQATEVNHLRSDRKVPLPSLSHLEFNYIPYDIGNLILICTKTPVCSYYNLGHYELFREDLQTCLGDAEMRLRQWIEAGPEEAVCMQFGFTAAVFWLSVSYATKSVERKFDFHIDGFPTPRLISRVSEWLASVAQDVPIAKSTLCIHNAIKLTETRTVEGLNAIPHLHEVLIMERGDSMSIVEKMGSLTPRLFPEVEVLRIGEARDGLPTALGDMLQNRCNPDGAAHPEMPKPIKLIQIKGWSDHDAFCDGLAAAQARVESYVELLIGGKIGPLFD